MILLALFNTRAELFGSGSSRVGMEKNTIYLSRTTKIVLSVIDGIRWMIAGLPKCGKSYAMSIMLNQLKHVLMFDPTGKFFDTLQEQGLAKRWIKVQLGHDVKHPFKMNVADVDYRAIDAMFPKTEDTQKKQKQRQAVEAFLWSKNKTYKNWVELCEKHHLSGLKRDLDLILSSNDSAPPILELVKGKKVIDCFGLSVRNPCIGVFTQSLIGARSKLDKLFLMNPNNFICIAMDEAHKYCQHNTPTGEAIAILYLEARKYGVGFIGATSSFKKLDPDIREKTDYYFIFNSPASLKDYTDQGLDLGKTDFDELAGYKHGCFVFSEDGEFVRHIVVPDLYFLDLWRRSVAPDFTILNMDVSFTPRLGHL